MSTAFASFASEIDNWIREIKDDFLQLKNKDHPRGLFEIVVTAPTFHLVRSAIQTDLTFQAFVDNCFGIFWILLEPSLEAARRLLQVDTKDKFVQIFTRLQETLRLNCDNDQSFLNLTTEIRNCSVEVQRQLDMMSDWLRRTEFQRATHRFTVPEMVDIAVESALKVHKTFHPQIEKKVAGSTVAVGTSVLVVVADILTILFDNIWRHAHSGTEPAVLLALDVDAESEVIHITVTNDVGRDAISHTVEQQLCQIRQIISEQSFRRQVQREGGSGFLKIASILHPSSRGNLEFGFSSKTEFSVTVTLPVVTKESALLPERDFVDANTAG